MKSSPSILRRPSTAPSSTQAVPSSVLAEAKLECPRIAISSAFQALTATTTLASLTLVSSTIMPSTFSPVPRSPASSQDHPPTVHRARPRLRALVLPLPRPRPSRARSRSVRLHPTSRTLLSVAPDTSAVLCNDSGRACTNLLAPCLDPSSAFLLILTITTARSRLPLPNPPTPRIIICIGILHTHPDVERRVLLSTVISVPPPQHL